MKGSKKLIQLGVLSAAILGITACATEPNYQNALETWHGAPVNSLLHVWGTPNETTHLRDGYTLLSYRMVEPRVPISKAYYTYHTGLPRLSPQTNEAMLSHTPKVMPLHSESFWCETQFEVNPKGTVVDTHFEGDNCVASQMKLKRLAFTR